MTGYRCLERNLAAMKALRDAVLNDERVTALQAPALSVALQSVMDCIEETTLLLEGK